MGMKQVFKRADSNCGSSVVGGRSFQQSEHQ
jgi:hypothetical protein